MSRSSKNFSFNLNLFELFEIIILFPFPFRWLLLKFIHTNVSFGRQRQQLGRWQWRFYWRRPRTAFDERQNAHLTREAIEYRNESEEWR